jgi:uncharacterized protein YegL
MVSASEQKRPGGEITARPLHFIWIADCSDSMGVHGKIQALNTAIREAIPHMRKVAKDRDNAQVLVRAVRFSDGAYWHIAQPVPVEQFEWVDLQAKGVTDMGKALELVAEQLKMPPMPERGLPPVLVLISDGLPTDDFAAGLNALLDLPWGKKAVRIAIAIGEDANLEVLQRFINNSELKPLRANNPEALTTHIRWASTAVLKSASSPHSEPKGASGGSNVPIPTPPSTPGGPQDVW